MAGRSSGLRTKSASICMNRLPWARMSRKPNNRHAAPPTWSLVRPVAMERLDGIPLHRLTTVVGGGGFGESSVLAAWGRGRSVAWYTLDASDRRLAALLGGLISALRAIRLPASEA